MLLYGPPGTGKTMFAKVSLHYCLMYVEYAWQIPAIIRSKYCYNNIITMKKTIFYVSKSLAEECLNKTWN